MFQNATRTDSCDKTGVMAIMHAKQSNMILFIRFPFCLRRKFREMFLFLRHEIKIGPLSANGVKLGARPKRPFLGWH